MNDHSRTGPALFALRSVSDGDGHTLTPAGELDLASAPELETELQRIEATDAHAIVLDLSALSFIDPTGLRLVVQAAPRARTNGDRLTLIRPAPLVFRAFEICGMTNRLPFIA